MATLELKQITKKFGTFTAVNSMDLRADDGEMIALLGGSGCGKTTTLRMIAGFTEPNEGQILVDGKDVSKIPPYKRNIAIFFQNYALFPHMTVFENVAFGLKMQKIPKDEMAQRVHEMLELVRMPDFDERYPRELSGGQQQRVALARALVTRPSILLLDEPLSNLDAKLRVEMQVEIKRIQKKLGITTIIVTHDHEEAVSLADRVIIMNAGKIQQIGTPQEIFDYPATQFVADFMGFSTFIKGKVAEKKDGKCRIDCGVNSLYVPEKAADGFECGSECTLGVRSEHISVVTEPGENVAEGLIESVTYKGTNTRLEVSGCFNETVYPAVRELAQCRIGDKVLISIPAQHIRVYK